MMMRAACSFTLKGPGLRKRNHPRRGRRLSRKSAFRLIEKRADVDSRQRMSKEVGEDDEEPGEIGRKVEGVSEVKIGGQRGEEGRTARDAPLGD